MLECMVDDEMNIISSGSRSGVSGLNGSISQNMARGGTNYQTYQNRNNNNNNNRRLKKRNNNNLRMKKRKKKKEVASSLRYTALSSPASTLSSTEMPLIMSSMSFPSFIQAIFFLGFIGFQNRFNDGLPSLSSMTIESDKGNLETFFTMLNPNHLFFF